MKFLMYLLRAAAVTLVLCVVSSHTHAQGFLRTITFDGAPIILPGNGRVETYYYEDSMAFTPISGGEFFSRQGPGREAFPENGTVYMIQPFGGSISGYRAQFPTPSHFGLYSVDLAEFSTLYNYPASIEFVGYLADGSAVTTTFTTDGIIDGTGSLADFQTFYFGQEFADIVRFEAPGNTYAMDNLVFFDVVPEPTSGALLLVGGAALWFIQARKKPSNR